jgi:hypothetical protein
VRFAIANENGAILDVDDARVRDRDFEDVRGQGASASSRRKVANERVVQGKT